MNRAFRNSFNIALAASVLLAMAGQASAQNYPNAPIRIFIGYNPGGAVDIVTRLFAERLSQKLGQQVVVENKPGGATVIASQTVVNAAPNGYTLMMADIAHGANPALQSKLPYDTKKAFTPISLVVKFPAVLVVKKTHPATSLKELVAIARSKPGALNYGSSGVGSMNFLGTELFKAQNGLDIVHIPYKSGGEIVTALLGGFVDLVITTVPPVVAHADNVRVLAVSSDRRLAAFPDAPTFAEAGMPEFQVQLWQGLLGPADLSPAIVQTLNAAVREVAKDPAIQKRIADLGGELVAGSPEELSSFIDVEIAKWKKVVTPDMRPN